MTLAQGSSTGRVHPRPVTAVVRKAPGPNAPGGTHTACARGSGCAVSRPRRACTSYLTARNFPDSPLPRNAARRGPCLGGGSTRARDGWPEQNLRISQKLRRPAARRSLQSCGWRREREVPDGRSTSECGSVGWGVVIGPRAVARASRRVFRAVDLMGSLPEPVGTAAPELPPHVVTVHRPRGRGAADHHKGSAAAHRDRPASLLRVPVPARRPDRGPDTSIEAWRPCGCQRADNTGGRFTTLGGPEDLPNLGDLAAGVNLLPVIWGGSTDRCIRDGAPTGSRIVLGDPAPRSPWRGSAST
jgi:hypothetical protein